MLRHIHSGLEQERCGLGTLSARLRLAVEPVEGVFRTPKNQNDMPNKKTEPQPLVAADYLKIAGVLLLVGICLLAGFVYLSAKLLPTVISDQLFYVILLLWGLICAVVLFGAMKGFAVLSVKQSGLLLNMGGPAVVALLVVVGGFKLVPRHETFSITVRPHAPGLPLVQAGRVRLEYGEMSVTRDIADGEVIFREIPREFWGKQAKVLPEVKGYAQQYQNVTLDKDAFDVTLSVEQRQSRLTGTIRPAPGKGNALRVVVEGVSGEATVDEFGRFQTAVPGHNDGEQVRVSVYENGRELYDAYQTLPGPISVKVLR